MSEKIDNVIKNVKIEEPEVKEQTIAPRQDSQQNSLSNELDIWGFLFTEPEWNIKVNETEIFFSGDITEKSMLDLIEKVDEVYERIEFIKRRTGIELPIKLIVNSPGGSVKAGFMAIDYLKSLSIKIESYVLGQAASMGFMLWLVGNKRDMSENASILIHQLRTGFVGRKDEFVDYMKHINDLHKQIINFVVKQTGIDKVKVEELFSRETWLTRQDAVKIGLMNKEVK